MSAAPAVSATANMTVNPDACDLCPLGKEKKQEAPFVR
ncbi:hypothetical protein MPF_0330 [Methanohalophilus portucalensis FDF-1]|uniref:Uncharacterized protein n=1 Tax=Methanohalophilus portucalensis FDF-1 TaxID=523843 RepID=A0A1L9C4S9_9EURY|nr:hypothetical protein MPF_0330 [Methanohalophilus portucalensis FDF-1]